LGPIFQHQEIVSTLLFASIKSGRGNIDKLLLEDGVDHSIGIDLDYLKSCDAA